MDILFCNDYMIAGFVPFNQSNSYIKTLLKMDQSIMFQCLLNSISFHSVCYIFRLLIQYIIMLSHSNCMLHINKHINIIDTVTKYIEFFFIQLQIFL